MAGAAAVLLLLVVGVVLLFFYLRRRRRQGAAPAPSGGGIAPSAPISGGGIIHAAMTDTSGNENVSAASITSFNNLAGKKIGVAYFTHHWFKTVEPFPVSACQAIKSVGATPFIRMNADELKSTVVNCAGINSGKYDTQLKAYAVAAKNFGSPICAEFGTEVNSKFLGFSGEGAGPFKAAHGHVVNIFRTMGASNVRFVYHGDFNGSGAAGWYPGDNQCAWVGTSMYGQSNKKGCAGSLVSAYAAFAATSKVRPLCVLEWGLGTVPDTTATLADIPTKYPRIKMMSYWNEKGSYDRRIDKSPANLAAYKKGISSSAYVSSYHD